MTPARTAWQPVLGGDEAASARRAVAEIAAALASGHASLGYDLADGAAGVALLFGYLARVTGDADHRAAAFALLDRAADQLACAPTGPSLFHGFAGVAWAADHLRWLLGDPDPSCNDEIDAAVATALDCAADALDCAADALGFDLVTGIVGLGVYALERAGQPAADRCTARMIARLAATARRVPDGVVWTAPDRPDRIDLGLAHGVPGVIALLARCARDGAVACSRIGSAADIAEPRTATRDRIDIAAAARELLDGAVAWLLAQRDPDQRFPACIVGDRPGPPARAGWCYGDAAIALALTQASQVGDPAWLEGGLAIARTAAARAACGTGVRGASLCHGAASLALIYQRLHHITGDPAFHAAARDWLLRLLADPKAPHPAPGLMNGAAGAGLVLLAASSEVAPDWDRALLLSGEQTRHAERCSAASATAL